MNLAGTAFINAVLFALAICSVFLAFYRIAPVKARGILNWLPSSGVITAGIFWILITTAGYDDKLQLAGQPMFKAGLIAIGLVLFGIIADLCNARKPLRSISVIRSIIILVAGYYLGHTLRIDTLKLPFGAHFTSLGDVAPIITALWLWLFAVVFGRAATIQGIPVGVACFATGTFWAVTALQPSLTSPQGAIISALICGACLPQLFMSPRLKIHSGTGGGYVIGFLVGVASIAGALKNTAFLVALIPLLVVGAPLFAAMYTWSMQLRPGFEAVAVGSRRQHLHEILLTQGYSPRQITLLILAGTGYLCLLALLLVWMIEITFILKALLVILALILGLAFFYVVLRMMRRPLPVASGAMPEPVNLMGINLHPVTMDQAMEVARKFIQEDKPHMVVTTDATGFMRAQDDDDFREIVNDADLVTPDGAGVVLAARLLNIPLAARCSGCDMVEQLCKLSAELGRSVYLLGAAPGVAAQAAEKLCERIPGLVIAGCRDGYFKDEDEAEILAEIRAARPAALFVALGIPRQEKWIKTHLEDLQVPICVGIGGSFDVISGLKKRAPVWMQRTGLEWLYRVWKEPWRLPRLSALPRIIIMAFKELLRPPREL